VSVVAPDLPKFLENLCLILRRDPDPVSLTEISTEPSACLALIPIRPPSGVNFTALERAAVVVLPDRGARLSGHAHNTENTV
jgi:hypothetical protein